MKSAIFAFGAGLLGLYAILIMSMKLHAETIRYVSESACVSKLIAQEIERSNITTGGGTCYEVKETTRLGG
jgi:hypothetical protein